MRRVQSNTLDVGIDVHLKNWSTAILSKHSVLRRFLQVDCEGPTLISYIVAKHLAHASRGTISPYRTSGSAYGGSYFGCHLRYAPIKVAYPAERSLLLSIALVKIGLSAIRQ